MESSHRVLLYYLYVPIENPEEFRNLHHAYCLGLNLRGRIIVSSEGINGTVCGTAEQTGQYRGRLEADSLFRGIEFKVFPHPHQIFPKLHVRHKEEIVHSTMDGIHPRGRSDNYLEPQQLKEALERGEDLVLLDVRSDYEYKLGKFKDARTLGISNFRDFKECARSLSDIRDKKVITYCTGGVRCEKASMYLRSLGFCSVYQLHGGIIRYGQETGGDFFEGSCYVFDPRVTMPVNRNNPVVISTCELTSELTERMVNCTNPPCNRHIAMSQKGSSMYDGACSEDCMEQAKASASQGSGPKRRKLNGYDPHKNSRRPSQLSPKVKDL